MDSWDCQHENKIEEVLNSGPHYAKLICKDCGKWFKFISKPDNEEKERRPHNNNYRKLHKKKDKCLLCSFCGITDKDGNFLFELDHIVPLEKDGGDIFENTRILCNHCHTLRKTVMARAEKLKKGANPEL